MSNVDAPLETSRATQAEIRGQKCHVKQEEGMKRLPLFGSGPSSIIHDEFLRTDSSTWTQSEVRESKRELYESPVSLYLHFLIALTQ
jgi:hypothetical protein